MKAWPPCRADLILEDVRAMSAGGSHLLLLREDGTVWICGADEGGLVQVGGGLINAEKIAAGAAHFMAFNSGSLWTWGDNSAGQLGTGNTQFRSDPGLVWDGTGRLR